MIDWAAANGRLDHVLDEILASGDLYTKLVKQLEECLDAWKLDQAAALAGAIGRKRLDGVLEAAPLAVYRWSTLNIALANHRGKFSGVQQWIELAEDLEHEVLQSDYPMTCDYHNHMLVHRHNRYHFNPELPDALNRKLEALESLYKQQCRMGTSTNKDIGRLYGTIAQNYAFCGPGYLETALSYFDRARTALGEGRANDLKPEWTRQLNYQVYAFLDAGRFEEAEKHLMQYLEVSDLKQVWQKLEHLLPFHHAALARYLADARVTDELQYYFGWSAAGKSQSGDLEHPRQLWNYNMGRLASILEEEKTAAGFYRKSLACCFSPESGPTINVMALLPLAGLKQIGSLKQDEIRSGERRIRAAAGELDRDHFQPLFEHDFETILDLTWAEPQTFFPFTYR
jgi:hypothetical protein